MRKGVNESNAQFYLRRQPKKVAHIKWIKLVQEKIPLPDSALSSVPYVCRHTVISSLQCMPRGALPHKSIHTNPGRLKPQIPRIKKTKLNITKQAKKKNALGSGLGGETESGDKMERDDLFYLHFISQ